MFCSMFRPYREIVEGLRVLVRDVLVELGFSVDLDDVVVEETRSRRYGDFYTNVCFRVAKRFGVDPRDVAGRVVRVLSGRLPKVISRVEAVGGYVNFFVDRGVFARFVLEGILGHWDFGRPFDGGGRRVVVEHTSANPIHPLHIGHARNAFIGDCLARVFRFVGFDVCVRFYVNDCGRQVAVLLYAFDLWGREPIRGVKLDHFFGILYSCVMGVLELRARIRKLVGLKRKILRSLLKHKHGVLGDVISRVKRMRYFATIDWRGIIDILRNLPADTDTPELAHINGLLGELKSTIRELKEWAVINNELAEKWPMIYLVVSRNVGEDAHRRISGIIRNYERGDGETVEKIKRVVEMVLEGFMETMNILGIKYDALDWESQLVSRGYVGEILREMEKRGIMAVVDGGAKALNIRKIMEMDEEAYNILGVGEEDIANIRNPVLVRRDGSSLYLLRDIAYAKYKIVNLGADVVLNVIGVDQRLEQKHVVIALKALGIHDAPQRYIHVAYELVRLPRRRMSSRRGRYISLDELISEAIERARMEVEKRYPDLSPHAKEALSKEIGIGALKFALLSSAPTKVIEFNWARVLDFEQNSGPFVQYSHARAASILRKLSWKLPLTANFEELTTNEEFELIYKLAKFPEVIDDAIRSLRPDLLCNYANELAMLFNKFYQKCPVLRAEQRVRDARILLVAAFRRTMARVLKLIGIKPLYRM